MFAHILCARFHLRPLNSGLSVRCGVFVLSLSRIFLWMKESQKSVECKKKSQQVFSPLFDLSLPVMQFLWSMYFKMHKNAIKVVKTCSWTTLSSSNSCIWWDWLVLHELAKKHKANQSFVGEIKRELRQLDSSKSEDYMWKYEAFSVSTCRVWCITTLEATITTHFNLQLNCW